MTTCLGSDGDQRDHYIVGVVTPPGDDPPPHGSNQSEYPSLGENGLGVLF